jgi:hypothetical protein
VRAYAVVSPGLVTSTASAAGLVSTQSSGFTTVRTPQTGVYCLTAAAGTTPSAVPAVVSGESSYSSAGVVPIATAVAQHSSPCSASEFEVNTYDAKSPANPSGGVAFTIVAP